MLTGTARPVRRQLLADSSPPGKGIIWQWEGDVRGQWNTFDMEVACLLEDRSIVGIDCLPQTVLTTMMLE